MIEIKIEKLPQRCEICHQNDKYDPAVNICDRCEELQNSTQSFRGLSFSKKTFVANKYFFINCLNGYFAGYLFELITHYSGFEMFFFYRQEKFLIPNWKYLLCAATIIPLGLFVSLIVNRFWNNIDLLRHRIACYVVLPITIFISGIVGIKIFYLDTLIFTPIMIAISEALILWFVTNRWYWYLFICMISSVFTAYLITYFCIKTIGYGNPILFCCAFLTALYIEWVGKFSKEKNYLRKSA